GRPWTLGVPGGAAREPVREGLGGGRQAAWRAPAPAPHPPPAPQPPQPPAPAAPSAPAFAARPAPEPEKRAPEPFEEEPVPAESSFGSVSPSVPEQVVPPSEAAQVGVPVDMVEKIAQRVVAQISEKVIREIAWEVIPDLAESLIKKEIDRLKAELQRT